MIKGSSGPENESASEEQSWLSVAIVPVAIPLLAGPGAISTVVVFSGQHSGLEHLLVVGVVILAVTLITYLFLRSGNLVMRVFGKTGIDVINKIMGMIVIAIAVEFLYDGFALHFPEMVTVHE